MEMISLEEASNYARGEEKSSFKEQCKWLAGDYFHPLQ